MLTTLYDLNKSATAAADSTLGKDALAVDSMKLEAFAAAGHDRADWPRWSQMFDDMRTTLTGLKAQKSVATLAAEAAAKATAQ